MLTIINIVGVVIILWLIFTEVRDTLIDKAEAKKSQTPTH